MAKKGLSLSQPGSSALILILTVMLTCERLESADLDLNPGSTTCRLSALDSNLSL